MPIKNIVEGRVYIPESEQERMQLEKLVEKEIVEYKDGGYWLSKKGVKIAKKIFKPNMEDIHDF